MSNISARAVLQSFVGEQDLNHVPTIGCELVQRRLGFPESRVSASRAGIIGNDLVLDHVVLLASVVTASPAQLDDPHRLWPVHAEAGAARRSFI